MIIYLLYNGKRIPYTINNPYINMKYFKKIVALKFNLDIYQDWKIYNNTHITNDNIGIL